MFFNNSEFFPPIWYHHFETLASVYNNNTLFKIQSLKIHTFSRVSVHSDNFECLVSVLRLEFHVFCHTPCIFQFFSLLETNAICYRHKQGYWNRADRLPLNGNSFAFHVCFAWSFSPSYMLDKYDRNNMFGLECVCWI